MTPEQLEIIRQAVRQKFGMGCDVKLLLGGLPKRHAVEWTLSEASDFILRQFATDQSETQLINRKTDKLRDDYP